MGTMNMDKHSKILYFSTIGLLSLGLCLSIIGPLLESANTKQAASLQHRAEPSPEAIDPLTVFADARKQQREDERNALKGIMDDQNSEPALVADASARLMKILDWADQETIIEGILKARGYKDAVAVIHLDSANILIRGNVPTRQQAAQILDLVSRETGLGGGNIKIIPIE